jgi:sec-independent protein translocase protein TatC
MSFIGHLEELRWHLIRMFLVVAVLMVGMFFFLRDLMDYVVLGPMRTDFPTNRLACQLDADLCAAGKYIGPIQFQATSPTEQFSKAIQIGLVGGLVVAFPYVVWELWRFIRPGLSRKEIRTTRGAVGVVSFLFFLGVAFTYFVILPFTFRFLANFTVMDEVQNIWRIGDVVSLITLFCLAGGLLFQMPVVAWVLSRLGILHPRLMRRYRRHALVVIVIVAGILTPSPDALSQLLLALPIIVLYEVSILIVGRNQKRSKAAHEAFMSNEA